MTLHTNEVTLHSNEVNSQDRSELHRIFSSEQMLPYHTRSQSCLHPVSTLSLLHARRTSLQNGCRAALGRGSRMATLMDRVNFQHRWSPAWK